MARVEQQIIVHPNGCSLVDLELDDLGEMKSESVVQARFVMGETVLARAALWPLPFKYLHIPDPGVVLTRLETGDVCVTARCPAKGVWLSTNEHAVWSNNMLDLFPDDPQVVQVADTGNQPIHVWCMGKQGYSHLKESEPASATGEQRTSKITMKREEML